MSSVSYGSIAVLATTIIGCAVSEPLDLKADFGNSDGSQATNDGPATATGGNRPSSQGSGGAAGASGGIGAGGAGGGAGSLGGTPGTAGNLGRGASGGASGQAGAGQGGAAGTAGGHSGIAGTAGGHSGIAGTAGRGGEGGGGHAGASAAPTFTEIYKDILSVYCGGSSCHYPGSQHGVGFSTQSGAYKSLISVAVIPGDSQGSTLYTLVATGVMPDGRPMLSSDFIDEIGAWIDAGALNN
jgi:hypothetical protein